MPTLRVHSLGSKAAAALLVALAAAACLPAGVEAQEPPELGGLLVAPTRVIFEGRRRSVELTLLNRGAEPATYRISFVQMRMDRHGGLQEVTTPAADERPADPLVRYSPRQVVLQPGESQTVRLMLRKPAELAPGEYRSHLVFRSVPPAADESAADSAAGRSGRGLEIRLTPVYGVSIPVIVRHGEGSAALVLTGLELLPAPQPALRLILERQGTRSVYGDLRVRHRPARGPARDVGRLRGVAVYTPNQQREVLLPLDATALAPGSLEVSFASGEEGEGAGVVLATASLRIP